MNPQMCWLRRKDSNLHTSRVKASEASVTALRNVVGDTRCELAPAGFRRRNAAVTPIPNWGDRSDSNRDYGVHIPACCRYTTVTGKGESSRLATDRESKPRGRRP